MTVLNPLVIPVFDPSSCISTPTRPVEGIVIARPVVLDADHDQYARWFKVATTGTVSYVGWDGVTVADTGTYAAGVWHPVYTKRINTSGTSATGIMWGN